LLKCCEEKHKNTKEEVSGALFVEIAAFAQMLEHERARCYNQLFCPGGCG
jgi:hypothetical protein